MKLKQHHEMKSKQSCVGYINFGISLLLTELYEVFPLDSLFLQYSFSKIFTVLWAGTLF